MKIVAIFPNGLKDTIARLISDGVDNTEYIDLIKVHYNTNLTKSKWKNKSIPEMLSKYKRLYIEASLDGVYETFEYTRDGANWKEVEKNWQEYYNSDCDV